MTAEIFIYGVIIVAIVTSLITQAIKAIRESRGKTYNSTIIAGVVAIIVAILVSIGYMLLTDMAFDAHAAVYIVALIIVSWIAATVGYDKIKEMIDSGDFQLPDSSNDESED